MVTELGNYVSQGDDDLNQRKQYQIIYSSLQPFHRLLCCQLLSSSRWLVFCSHVTVPSSMHGAHNKRTPIMAGSPSSILSGEEKNGQLAMPCCDTGSWKGGYACVSFHK